MDILASPYPETQRGTPFSSVPLPRLHELVGRYRELIAASERDPNDPALPSPLSLSLLLAELAKEFARRGERGGRVAA